MFHEYEAKAKKPATRKSSNSAVPVASSTDIQQVPALATEVFCSQVQHFTPYAGPCLSLTMELARIARSLIIPYLVQTTESWAFDDRVLAWLVPTLQDDIRAYYETSGPSMIDGFTSNQIEHIDQVLFETLVARLEELRPGTLNDLRRD